MRYKDYKQYHNTVNMSKVYNILNKCNCTFIALLDKDLKKLDMGICKYVMFNDKMLNSTHIIEYKKLSVNNIYNVVNREVIES